MINPMETINKIPDPIQQAIWAVLKWVWNTYGKDQATKVLESMVGSIGNSDWLDDMLKLFKVSDDIDWEKYIIPEIDMTCKQE